MYQYETYCHKLPRPLVRFLRNIFLFVLDLKDRLGGKSPDLVPPRSLHFIGGGDFKTIGETFIRHFIAIGHLRPEEAVLDIGCGTGRMAIPLMKYLNPAGSYVGFDISLKAITWCRRTITTRKPNFVFHYADIRNTEYNPRGHIFETEYRFPCEDNTIDFAFAISVFTHMRRAAVARYLRELSRVLKPFGRAMLSFFIIDEEAGRLIRARSEGLDFPYDLGDCRTIDPVTPERAIAYVADDVASMATDAGLRIKQPVLFGSWSGRTSMLDAQDVVIVTKLPGV